MVAVVSHKPGCVRVERGAMLEGKLEVEVNGGICKEMETAGEMVTEAIKE